MNIIRLSGIASEEMEVQLENFEKEFRYPLGPDDSFSISHSPEYSLFFRGMGEATIHLAESGGKIVGSQAVVRREVKLACGSLIPAVYFCDTKVVENRRGGIVLGRLVVSACQEALDAGYTSGFSVVMEGSITSDKHTGRLGIPHFSELAKVKILRFDTGTDFSGFPSICEGLEYHRISGGDGSLCSEMRPLVLSVEGASGVLLDTRRGETTVSLRWF